MRTKHKRKCHVLEEKGLHRVTVLKSIETPALEDGGRKHPAQGLPGGSFLSEEDKGPIKYIRVTEQQKPEEEEEEEDKGIEKQIKADPTKIFLTYRLPDKLKDKLTELSKKIADEHGTEPEEVDHVTLLFVPLDVPVSEEKVQKVLDAVKTAVEKTKVMEAQLQGWIQFDNEKNTVLALSVDSVGLADLYVAMKGAVEKEGIDSKQIHGFIPHATIAYLPKGARVEELPVLGDKFTIDQVEFVHSDISEIVLAKEKTLGEYEHVLVGNDGKLSFYETALKSASTRDGAHVVEFFAGRGLSLVSTFSKLKHLAVDKNKTYLRAYKKRHPKAKVICSDNIEAISGGLLNGLDIAVADFDASGKPHDALKAFFENVEVKNPLLLTTTWGFVNEAFRHGMNRKVAVRELSKYIETQANLRKISIKFLGWSYPTSKNRNIIYCAYSVSPKKSMHLESFFPSTVEALVSVTKYSKFAPDLDPSEKTDKELMGIHWQLHLMYRKEGQSPTDAKWSTEKISNLHALVVDELYERGTRHPAPPDDGLDDVSEDFERYEEQQPDWTKPVPVEKRYQRILRSGVKRGRKVTLEEVLPHFESFKLRKPYIYLVGGLANHGETEGDIDILVKDSDQLPEDFKHALHFRLGRALPGELAERLEIHYDNFHGPFTNFVELFDMTFERINPENKVKEMRLISGVDSITSISKQDDKLIIGKFFSQPKPTRAAIAGELMTVESLLRLYREHEEWLPTFIQKKYDGANHQIHKDGDKVTVYSEDGDDNTDRLPGLVEEIQALKPDKLALVAEIEKWDGQQHLPREATAGYLNAKSPADDSDLVANVYDILWFGKEDIHGKPTKERLEYLKKLGVEQSTMGIPDLNQRINIAPSIEVSSLKELEKAVRKVSKLPGSEGIVAKQSGASYRLEAATKDEWVKYHNTSTIRGIVYDRTPVKGSPGVWTYHYGVREEPPTKTLVAGGFSLSPVGDTFNSSLDFEKGDIVLIEAETVNLEKSPKDVRLTAWVPRLIGPWEGKPDTVRSAANRAERNRVLQEKEIDEEGNVKYLPVRKQADPYLEIPNEDKGPYKYTVHHHFRGKSLHSDLRIGFRPKKLLVGWTMNTQIKEGVKEPVTTLKEAQRLAREDMDEISKINWSTGGWAKRPKAGTTKLVRTSILSERKAPEPWEWLNVEGKTKEPEPGKPPPVGGTRQFPGVFDIVDQGKVEFGAQKPQTHEYFFHNGALSYRMFFRQLRIAEKAVLPPSEEQGLPGPAWLAIRPDDQTPNVLSDDEVEKGWMPPLGVSAVPASVRKQIPKEYRYWEKRTLESARETRAELHEAMKKKEVELDFGAPYKRIAKKASMLESDFVLQEQTWRGPVQIRVGPSRTLWWLRFDVGRPDLIAVRMFLNPLDNEELAVEVEDDPHKNSMEISGAVKPGHYLNPTKETPSNIEILDSGKASVLSYSKDFLKVELKGKKLKGLFAAKRQNDEWQWGPSQPGPEVSKDLVEVQFGVSLTKVDKEKKLITGVVLEPDMVDGQGDTISREAIERSAHKFLSKYNRETQLGLLHKQFGEIGVELVESWIVPSDLKIGGQKVPEGTWLMTVHVLSDSLWKKVKSGEFTGFSIGGTAMIV